MQREGKSLFSVAFRLSVALFLPSSRHESDFNHTRARGALVVPSSFGFMEVRSLGTQKTPPFTGPCSSYPPSKSAHPKGPLPTPASHPPLCVSTRPPSPPPPRETENKQRRYVKRHSIPWGPLLRQKVLRRAIAVKLKRLNRRYI